jgi:hypothetical protein
MGSTQDKNSLRRLRMPRTYRDLTQKNVGNRLSDDIRMLRDAINTDRAILNLPAPTGLRATSLPAAVLLEWNELAESFRKSIDGARVWRAPRALGDDKNWYSNPNKTIIVPVIRSTTYADPVGSIGDEFIYWVQWINLDGKESGASAGTVGFALWDDAAPGPLENLHVIGGEGNFRGSWENPLTDIMTLDGFAQQYSSTSGFTTAGGNICTTWWIGKIYGHDSTAPGKTYWFRYAAHNLSGDTETNADPRLVAILPDGWGPWTPAPENPVQSGWFTGTDDGPPSSINVAASANGLSILFGAEALINGMTGEEGQLRIKREENPGVTLCNLTTPDVDIDKIPAITGCRFTWVAPKPGRYFYSWRLRNSFGWSDWSGDPTLVNVPNFVQTTNEIDSGPPQDWTITCGPGTDQNSVFVYTSRPKIGGANLLWVFYQVKDTSQGAWRAYDENAGAAVTFYDGSAINHRLDDDGTKLYRESGVGFGSAKVDDMLLVDVRGGQFHRNYCQWALIRGFEGGNAATASYLEIGTGVRPQVNAGLRVKVVKPNWTWNTEGYFGDLPAAGCAGEFIAGKTDQQFVSAPIPIDADVASVDARVWFGNHYSISDASSPMNPPTVSLNQVKVKRLRSTVLPGPLEVLSVTGANGRFVAKWNDPLTGYETLDDIAVQFADNASFLSPDTSTGWGPVNTVSSTAPNKTYWFRFAAHNESDLDSHATTASALGPKGWGPWTAFGSSVSSGALPGAGVPVDSVIPGAVTSLSVTAANGDFKAEWRPPTTGNLTIDNYAEEYRTDPGFTTGGDVIQLGDILYSQGTDPGKTYYFRFAAHNASGLTSDPSTAAQLGPTGWGPWTNAPENPVSSGGVPGAPVNTVIPTAVLGLSVTGQNGKFLATWNDPSTGYETLDDTAIQYTTDAAFTVNGPGSPAKGWGKRNSLDSTAPDKRYYFRVAVHNQSGAQSHATTAGLGATGWGPWAVFGAPTLVYSGLIPLNPTQISENLLYNGGFEIIVGGLPDGWVLGQTSGPGPYAWASNEYHNEGNWGVVLQTSATNAFAILSKSFAVRPGERLYASLWIRSSGAATPALIFRMFFHATDPDFGAGTSTYVDIVPGVNVPYSENFVKYDGQFTVPPGMFWCRVGLYNWSPSVANNYHFDDVLVARIITGDEIDDNTLPPSRGTGEARTIFVETFEEGRIATFWVRGYRGTLSIVSGVGIDGGKVLRASDMCSLETSTMLIPYDPRKLYRMTTRYIARAWGSAARSTFFAGVLTFNVNKVAIAHIYVAANAFIGYPMGAGESREFTGFFKGLGSPVVPAPDPTAPSALPTGTAYFSPVVVMNYDASSTPADITDVDDIRIDILEEEQYTTKAPNGTMRDQSVQVFYPWDPAATGDAKSSAISYYWTYDQGLVKADQFALYMTDGTAYHIERVRALPGASGIYEVSVFQVASNRAFNVSIEPEAIGASGVTPQSGYAYPPVTPSVSSGSPPVGRTVVGRVDWAGGNIWYDSVQYRNNKAPTNGVTALTVGYYHTGSGASRALLSGFSSYSQGPYIATHLAVIIKMPAGTITLGQDMVVCYMSVFPNIPSSYSIPVSIPDNAQGVSIGLAAVAEVKNGRVFHGQFCQIDRNVAQTGQQPIGPVWLQCVGEPSDGLGRRILIGHTEGGDTVKFYSDLYVREPVSDVLLGRFGANSTAGYLTNTDNVGIFVTQGINGVANFGLGVQGFSNFGGAGTYNALKFTDGGWSLVAPVGGGMIVPYLGTGHWVGTSGSNTTFGPAGPHCERCGYDFWLLSVENIKWGAYLHICGWCGAVYKKGPKTVLRKLTKQQRSEILRQGCGFLMGGEKNALPEKPQRSLRRRDTRRKGKRDKSRVRSPGRRALRIRHKNRTA